jgi:hypothetical protein
VRCLPAEGTRLLAFYASPDAPAPRAAPAPQRAIGFGDLLAAVVAGGGALPPLGKVAYCMGRGVAAAAAAVAAAAPLMFTKGGVVVRSGGAGGGAARISLARGGFSLRMGPAAAAPEGSGARAHTLVGTLPGGGALAVCGGGSQGAAPAAGREPAAREPEGPSYVQLCTPGGLRVDLDTQGRVLLMQTQPPADPRPRPMRGVHVHGAPIEGGDVAPLAPPGPAAWHALLPGGGLLRCGAGGGLLLLAPDGTTSAHADAAPPAAAEAATASGATLEGVPGWVEARPDGARAWRADGPALCSLLADARAAIAVAEAAAAGAAAAATEAAAAAAEAPEGAGKKPKGQPRAATVGKESTNKGATSVNCRAAAAVGAAADAAAAAPLAEAAAAAMAAADAARARLHGLEAAAALGPVALPPLRAACVTDHDTGALVCTREDGLLAVCYRDGSCLVEVRGARAGAAGTGRGEVKAHSPQSGLPLKEPGPAPTFALPGWQRLPPQPRGGPVALRGRRPANCRRRRWGRARQPLPRRRTALGRGRGARGAGGGRPTGRGRAGAGRHRRRPRRMQLRAAGWRLRGRRQATCLRGNGGAARRSWQGGARRRAAAGRPCGAVRGAGLQRCVCVRPGRRRSGNHRVPVVPFQRRCRWGGG